MQDQKMSLSVPGAIVIAGALIAAGIYMSKPTPVVNKVATVASIKIEPVSVNDHILGNPDAPIIFVEFSDTECPFCKTFQTTLQTVIDTYGKEGKVAWVYRHFPLDNIHSKARKEAEATECAAELGGNALFWKYIDRLFTITTSNDGLDPLKLPVIAKDVGLDVTKFNTCLSSGKYAGTVDAQFQDGVAAGARGTPYNVMILKKAVSNDVETTISEYVTTHGLIDRDGKPYIQVSETKKEISLNGALPLDILKFVIDTVLK